MQLLRRPEAWVFVILFGSYAFFWHSRDWNTASRLMLTYAIVDRGTILLDGQATTVAGVMPAGFQPPIVSADIWAPIRIDPSRAPRGIVVLRVLGQLARQLDSYLAQFRPDREINRIRAEILAAVRGQTRLAAFSA